jgi:hypothetical protein
LLILESTTFTVIHSPSCVVAHFGEHHPPPQILTKGKKFSVIIAKVGQVLGWQWLILLAKVGQNKKPPGRGLK